jgi:hypothetical protein
MKINSSENYIFKKLIAIEKFLKILYMNIYNLN